MGADEAEFSYCVLEPADAFHTLRRINPGES